ESVGIRSQRISRGEEECTHARAQEPDERVRAAEVRQLDEIPPVLEEDLGNRETWIQRIPIYRCPGDVETDEVVVQPAHREARNDVAVRRDDRCGERLQPAAVDLDGEGSEVVSRVRAIGVDEGLEEDRLSADELGATGENQGPPLGRHWRRAGGEMRHLPALPGREIEHEDLHRLDPSGSRAEIREGDSPTVRAEEYRRGEDPDSRE